MIELISAIMVSDFSVAFGEKKEKNYSKQTNAAHKFNWIRLIGWTDSNSMNKYKLYKLNVCNGNLLSPHRKANRHSELGQCLHCTEKKIIQKNQKIFFNPLLLVNLLWNLLFSIEKFKLLFHLQLSCKAHMGSGLPSAMYIKCITIPIIPIIIPADFKSTQKQQLSTVVNFISFFFFLFVIPISSISSVLVSVSFLSWILLFF